jgi:phosphoribosylformylglycinamidine cyclo-ligase
MMADDKGLTYAAAGVVSVGEKDTFKTLIDWVSRSLDGHPEVKAEVGLYATVLEVAPNLGIALTTDGVGTKLLVAEMMGRYDTVGIDCVAMNVNDIICVGARPIAMLDYIAVEDATHRLLGEVGKGLYEGAQLAGISIPAGEVAQLREMIKGLSPGSGFDLVGTAVGVVALDRMVVGERIATGDVVIGVASSGLHSNGYTLARKVLLGHHKVDEHLPELGMTVGEAMLMPTVIYVRPALEVLQQVRGVKGLVHITGDGFRNLQRVRSDVGFVLDTLPAPPPIFQVLQREGGVTDAEMVNTFNMGIGLCVVAEPGAAKQVAGIFHAHGMEAGPIGHAVADPERTIRIPSLKVVGKRDKFYAE